VLQPLSALLESVVAVILVVVIGSFVATTRSREFAPASKTPMK
jgi:hypothetical protein